MKIFVGVHGGAQKSTALAFDPHSGQEASVTGIGFPLHQTKYPHDEIWLAFQKLMKALANQLDLSPEEFREAVGGICVVLPGVFRPDFRDLGNGVFSRSWCTRSVQPPIPISVIDDTEAVLHSGPTSDGVAAVCGSGAAVYARCGDRDTKVDGWGPFIGDSGSAMEIGITGLQAVAKAKDGRGILCSTLVDLVENHILNELEGRIEGADAFDHAISWISDACGDTDRQRLRKTIAGIAPVVDAAAVAGDKEAERIIRTCAGHLVESVEVAVSRVGLSVEFNVFFEGGVVEGSRTFQTAFIEGVQTLYPSAVVNEPKYSTAAGAVVAAMAQNGRFVDVENRLALPLPSPRKSR